MSPGRVHVHVCLFHLPLSRLTCHPVIDISFTSLIYESLWPKSGNHSRINSQSDEQAATTEWILARNSAINTSITVSVVTTGTVSGHLQHPILEQLLFFIDPAFQSLRHLRVQTHRCPLFAGPQYVQSSLVTLVTRCCRFRKPSLIVLVCCGFAWFGGTKT